MQDETDPSPMSLTITSPGNNAHVRNAAINVSGTTSIQLPIVLRMFKGGTEVAKETASRNGNQWSAQIKGTYEPGSYRIEVTQSGPVNVTVNLYVPAPHITLPRNGDVTGTTFLVTGTGGEPVFGTIKLYASPGNAFLKDATLVANGSWTAQIALPPNIYSFYAKQRIGSYDSADSNTVTIGRVPAPHINVPAKNGLSSSRPVFAGQGYSAGATVDVWQKTPRKLLVSEATVDALKQWSKVSSEVLPTGVCTVFAIQKYLGGESVPSADHSFTVFSTPIIRTPESTMPQDMAFTITGDTGNNGAGMEILVDLAERIVVGTGSVKSGGSWDVRVNVTPGPVSLVAEQFVGSERSGRSAPRTFKIRPAKLDVKREALSAEQWKFSGSGHTGATVEISGGPVLLTTRVANGMWEVVATGWVPNTYSLSAMQKVSDNAGGSIPSLPTPFTFTWPLASPTEVTYTKDYTPTFSGKGYPGAMVFIAFPGGTPAAPNVEVDSKRGWSSKASQEWGPVNQRVVYVQQRLNGQSSPPNWLEIKVTIAPLAPVISSVVENGWSPTVSGTCWPEAVVNLVYSDSTAVHKATVTGGRWTFRRETAFTPDVEHRVTVTQTFASLPSDGAVKAFTVLTPLLPPVITEPRKDEEVGRDLIIRGKDGVKGATMKLRDAQFDRPLGTPKELIRDGDWEIELKGLEFRKYTVDAAQGIGSRESLRSEYCFFEVVVLPPKIEVPTAGGDLPRTSTISGTGLPGGRVDVWLQGHSEPLFRGIEVDHEKRWKCEVTLPIGAKTIWAKQTFDNEKPSKDSPPLTYNVVPSAPYMETPADNERTGRWVVVSGFGYPGDTVAVALADAPQTMLRLVPVLGNRTWSVRVELDRPGGVHRLIAVQSRDGFKSAPSSERPVLLGSYLPTIDEPAQGRWVTPPVVFSGKGRLGTGELVSGFNPEQVLASGIPVTAQGWQLSVAQPLPRGGNWVRFRQVIQGEAGSSDWAESERFEVAPQTPPSE